MKYLDKRKAMYKGHQHFARKTNNSFRSFNEFVDTIRFSEQDGILKYYLPKAGMVTESLAIARRQWRHHIMVEENSDERNRDQ